MINWSPILLSLKCGILSALINLPWGIFWGWLLARKQFTGKVILQTVLYSPLVLPPVLTGYLLLVVFSRKGLLGSWLESVFHLRFVLDWKGAVLAAAVVSSPFMIQMVKQAVERVDSRLELAARSLGANGVKVFRTITFPLAWHGVVAGFFLAFARSVGEFGATVIVAGNIPHKTQTIPLAIYSSVYLGQEQALASLVIASGFFAYIGLACNEYFIRRLP